LLNEILFVSDCRQCPGIYISEGSIAMCLSCDGVFKFHYMFTAESDGETVLKIGQHLAKLWARVGCFFTHVVYCN